MLYPAELSMREARSRYFAHNGFGADGGYEAPVVWFQLGPLKLPVPNVAARRAAVRYHDLHHIVTGYETDWRGEFEIAAYEIGAGCGRLWFAWAINLAGLLGGLVLLPRRTSRAFFRGRHSHSLYGEGLAALLDRSVAEVRKLAGCDRASEKPRAGDRVTLVAWGALAMALHAAPLAVVAVAVAV